LLGCSANRPADAAVVYSYTESVDGSFSSDSDSPTNLGIFLPGINQVTGQVTAIGDGGFNFTNDVFTFEIPSNAQLVTITMSSFSTAGGAGGMFMMLDDGPTFEFQSDEVNDQFSFGPDLSLILGGSVVGGGEVGTDILDDLQNAFNFGNGSFFTTPLGPGSYSVYLQETGSFSNYSLAFNVSAVPEPSSWAVLGVFVIGGMLVHHRKSNLRKKAK
jgi:hypothetical protein